MIELTVTSFQEFHNVVKEHNQDWSRWYYRGHSRVEYSLRPKVGREPFATMVSSDKVMFEKWKRHAVAYVTAPARELSEWDWLAIAQHHGLATRLLDWTFNPLAAAFFAIVSSTNEVSTQHESVVYAHYSSSDFVDIREFRDPFGFSGIRRLAPSSVAPRIGRQGGIFTVHGPPSHDLQQHLTEGDELKKIVIDRSCKKEFAMQLSHYGVNRLSLFPDLDGLSAHINWSFTNLPYQ